MEYKNKHFILFSMIIILVSLFLTSCSDREPTNPYDPEVGAEFPPVVLESVSIVDMAKLQVSWSSDYEYYTYFELQRSVPAQTASFSKIAEIPQGTFSYTDTLVNADTTYYYRVKGMVDELSGPYSNQLSGSLTLSAPSQFSVLAMNDNQIQLNWSFPTALSKQNTNENKINREGSRFDLGFAIERKDDEGDFVEITRINSNVFSFVDTELSSEVLYTYRMRTFLNQSFSSYTPAIAIQTMPLVAPTELSAEPISDQIVSLSWVDNCSFEEGFVIERKTEEGTFEEIAQLEADVTSYQDEGLIFGTSYTYRVAAVSTYNISDYSNEVISGTIFPAPTELTLTALNDHQVQVQWNYSLLKGDGYYWVTSSSLRSNEPIRKKWNSTESTDRFEEGFSIERKTVTGNFIEVGTTEAGVTEFVDSGLLVGVTYTYRVRAFTSLNYSGYSNAFAISTTFPAPTDLALTPISDQLIELNWVDNCEFEHGFIIERGEDGGEFEEIAEVNAYETTYTDSLLIYGILYSYRVKAFTFFNESDYTNEATVATIFPIPNNLVTEVISVNSISLSWDDNCDFEEGYILMCSENGGGFYEVVTLGENVTSFTHEDLTYGSDFTYYVYAFTSLNISNYSDYVTTTLIMPAPTDLVTQAINDQSVTLNWSDNCEYEEGFKVERKDDNGDFIEIATLGMNAVSYTDEALIFGTDYTYRVRAFVTPNLYSDYSNETTIQTIFPAPTDLNIQLNSDTEIQINWSDNCDFETGYSIERRDGGSSFVEISQVSENVTTYIDNDLIYGLHYYYRVRAFTQLNHSDYTGVVDTILEITAPTNLTATANVTEILLEWDDNTNIEENYEIERKIDGEDFAVIATVNQDITNYTDTNVDNMVTYFYRVRAITQNNQSEYSNIANATLSNTMLLVPYFYPTIQGAIDEGDPDPQYHDPDWTRNDMGTYGGQGGGW